MIYVELFCQKKITKVMVLKSFLEKNSVASLNSKNTFLNLQFTITKMLDTGNIQKEVAGPKPNQIKAKINNQL